MRAGEKDFDTVNKVAKDLSTKLKIEDRMEYMAKQQAFITLKDHKDNFVEKPTCRLINPAKSELGLVSKQMIERINNSVRNQTQNKPMEKSSISH